MLQLGFHWEIQSVEIKWFLLIWHYPVMFSLLLLILSNDLFLIIKTNAKQQMEEDTRCRHATREKTHSRGKPGKNSSFSRFKMRRQIPLQLRFKTTSICQVNLVILQLNSSVAIILIHTLILAMAPNLYLETTMIFEPSLCENTKHTHWDNTKSFPLW